MLLDTGSPWSFHKTGLLEFCGREYTVPKSIPKITTDYLLEKIGAQIDGLIGMDVINQIGFIIGIKDGFLCQENEESILPFRAGKHNNGLNGLFSIQIMVNGKLAEMIVDTGAHLSYINPTFTSDCNSAGQVEDFSPFIGDFKVESFWCEVDTLIGDNSYTQMFATPPSIIAMTLQHLHVDGIIGVDLFKQYRLHILGGRLYLPPQGI